MGIFTTNFLLLLQVLIWQGPAYPEVFNTDIQPDTPSESFIAKFETTKGDFKIEAKKKWAPLGYDRLYELIQSGFYTDIAIYRVIPGTVAQFGIHTDRKVNVKWDEIKLKDDPVDHPNYKWTVSFAHAGKDTRGTEIFINLKQNYALDDEGFAVVGKVTSGMNTIQSFYSDYGGKITKDLNAIHQAGNLFLRARYPNLDYIHKAYIIEEK